MQAGVLSGIVTSWAAEAMPRQDVPLDPPAQSEGDGQDAPLVQAALQGSREAFSDLVRRHQQAVFRVCRRYVSDSDTAAELSQRSFIKAIDRLGDLREAGTFRGWILRIAANLCLNHLRDNARFVDDTALAAMPTAPVAHEALEAQQERATLLAAVEQLPTKQRLTLELRTYEDLSFRDIGVALGISEGAAKVNYHYAVRRLRTLLAPGASVEDGNTP
jgi:RNA polymerase sigma-70 factor, ECF subfamily